MANRGATAVLVDAGPLVALLDRGDAHHAECVEALQSIKGNLVTVWPAFTEAMYLLGFSWSGQNALWEMIESGALSVAVLDSEDAPRMKTLMRKYRDLPMDLADAALVRVAERERVRQIFTLDRRHFRTYRPAGLGGFTILP
jgi:uncharacterized protein